jgi:hypothetical protein
MIRFDIELARFMADDLNALAERQPDDIHDNARLYLESCANALDGRLHVAEAPDGILYINRPARCLTTLLYDTNVRRFMVTPPSTYQGMD